MRIGIATALALLAVLPRAQALDIQDPKVQQQIFKGAAKLLVYNAKCARVPEKKRRQAQAMFDAAPDDEATKAGVLAMMEYDINPAEFCKFMRDIMRDNLAK